MPNKNKNYKTIGVWENEDDSRGLCCGRLAVLFAVCKGQQALACCRCVQGGVWFRRASAAVRRRREGAVTLISSWRQLCAGTAGALMADLADEEDNPREKTEEEEDPRKEVIS